MQTGKLLLLTFPVSFFSFFSSCDTYCFGFSFQSHAFDEIIKKTGARECLVSNKYAQNIFAYLLVSVQYVVKKSV